MLILCDLFRKHGLFQKLKDSKKAYILGEPKNVTNTKSI